MDSAAFWLGYLYEHSLVAEAAFDLVRVDIVSIAKRLETVEHNQALRTVALIAPQGNA